MIKVATNKEATYGACPILNDASVLKYLSSGTLEPGATYSQVPPGKIVRNRGFWLKPSYRPHHAASLFLVSTDSPAMNADELHESRLPIFCYYAETSKVFYLGRIGSSSDDQPGKCLTPIIVDEFPPIPLGQLRYIGKVIAAQ